MSARGKGGGDPAARALRALERGASSLGGQVARAVGKRWRRMPAERRARLEGMAASVRQQALEAPPNAPDRDVTEIAVRDLRAELARELERLSGADIRASRGSGAIESRRPPAP